MNKRGISTIVATVLIVLITVAAVTILWAAISPLIDKNLQSGTACFDAQNSLSIDADKQYTCYDALSDTIYHRIQRNSNDVTLEGATLIYSVNGTSYNTEISVPNPNGNIVSNNISSTDINTTSDVTFSIAPKILIEGEVTACTATNPIPIQAC